MRRRIKIRETLAISFFALLLYGADAMAQGTDGNSIQPELPMDGSAMVPASGTFQGENPGFLTGKSETDLKPLTNREKFKYFLNYTYGPESVLFLSAATGINQARDSVPEWGQGMEGYGKRFVSAYGRRSLRYSIQMSLGIMLHEDPRYFPSQKTGIWKRVVYAGSQAFVAHKDDGGTRPGYSRFIGAFGSAYISRQWHPESYQTAQDYLTSGAASIGFDVARNIFREFWGDLKKKLR